MNAPPRALMEATGEDYDTCREKLYNGGYRVYTSIDMDMQELFTEYDRPAAGSLQHHEFQRGPMLYSPPRSVSTMRPVWWLPSWAAVPRRMFLQTIPAYLSFRQPEARIKPLIVYTPALERGYTASSTVIDSKEEDGPENSGGSYAGPISLRTAVEQSKNTVAPTSCCGN